MLTQEDLRKIGELMDERTETVLTAVKAGFDGTSERLDAVDGRFDGVERRLDGVEGRLDGVEKRLNGVDGKMVTKDDFDRKLGNFEVRLTERYDHRYARRG
jgi:hypothetical protein